VPNPRRYLPLQGQAVGPGNLDVDKSAAGVSDSFHAAGAYEGEPFAGIISDGSGTDSVSNAQATGVQSLATEEAQATRATPTEYSCPQDNGVKYSTSVVPPYSSSSLRLQCTSLTKSASSYVTTRLQLQGRKPSISLPQNR
jgi:hypothetical protein